MKKSIAGGVLDSGLTSLTSLQIFFYAQSVFSDPKELGYFSLFMATVLLATTLVRELIYIPAQKSVLHLESGHRILLVSKMIGLGFKTATVTRVTVLLATSFLSLETAASQVLTPFTVTAYLAAITLPVQEHSRRMLHLAGVHASAVTVTAAQLIIAIALPALASLLDAPAAWVPFSVITLARMSSLTVALVMIHLRARSLQHVQPDIIQSTRAVLTARNLMVNGCSAVQGLSPQQISLLSG